MQSPSPLLVHRETFRDRPGFDAAVSHALLRAVARGEHPECLRLYEPADALAFSALDRTGVGFDEAAARARAAGFEPMIRLTGGRAAAFERHGLAFAWALPIEDTRGGIHERFGQAARWVAGALASLGIDARIGCVPREYCPGDYSVNVGGRIKLMGVGQRVVRGAAHVGGVIVVRSGARVREVLTGVYEALDYAFDPATAGALEDVLPDAQAAGVAEVLLHALAGTLVSQERALETQAIPPAVVEAADALAARHELERGAVVGAGHPKALAEA